MSEVARTTSSKDTRLLEMHVSNLGVIENASLIFSSGMTALTGETGAGKTLIVTALQLLTGQRADSGLIGPLVTRPVWTRDISSVMMKCYLTSPYLETDAQEHI